MTPTRFAAPTFALIVALSGCHKPTGGLQGGAGVLVADGSIDLGSIYQGARKPFTTTLGNSGNSVLNLQLAVSGDPQVSLMSETNLSIVPGDHFVVSLQLQADNLGAPRIPGLNVIEALVSALQITGDANYNLPITALVIADLTCTPSGPCLQSSFDPNQGQCVEVSVPDNQPCDDGDPCTTNKACQGGLCKGIAATCEDTNVCTVDFCQKGVGCQHLDESARCEGSDPCQIYYCDPQSGCQASPAADFTPCEASIPCQKANVCLGGHCTGIFLPDGIPCISPINPCATDALCQGGACYSPSAAKLQPGDILWQVVSATFSDGDGGSIWDGGGDVPFGQGFSSASAIDSDGNFYTDDYLPDGGAFMVSYDVCGKERWRDPIESSIEWTNGRHVLASDVLFTVLQDQTILGQSQLTGTHLWSFDPQSTLGIAAGADFIIKDVALGVNGVFYYTASWLTQDGLGNLTYQRMIGGLLRNGQSKFQTVLPSQTYTIGQDFGYPLLVDENENLYTSMSFDGVSSEIESYDQEGTLRFAIPVPRSHLNSFSENQGFFLEPISLTAFDSNGRQVWTLDDQTMISNGHSPIVSNDDHLSILRHPLNGGVNQLDNFDPVGKLSWSTPIAFLPGDHESSVVLDGLGILYFVNANQLYAVQEADGAILWVRDLPSQALAYQGVLSLTPAGSLVASVSERLIGVFVGDPMARAPWPRFRGDNQNRSSAAANPSFVTP